MSNSDERQDYEFKYGPREAAPLRNSEIQEHERNLLRELHKEIHSIARNLGPWRGPADGGSRATGRAMRPWVRLETDRRNRVYVIDGGRGTGKTTLLATLLDKYRGHSRAYEDGQNLYPDPAWIRALPILDFDPLPDELSVHGWLLQPWAQLTDHLAGSVSRRRQPAVDPSPGESLAERWRALQDAAICGWNRAPNGRQRSERLIDERHRLEEYHSLVERWLSFVDAVFDELRGREPGVRVLVVPIDDVDLQVGRNIELLHALRLFRHPRVVYLLTADLEHCEAVLRLHFLNEHLAIAGGAPVREAADEALSFGRLATSLRNLSEQLARATMDKAFPSLNVKRIGRLSVKELLAVRYSVPGGKQRTLGDDFQELKISHRGAAGRDNGDETTLKDWLEKWVDANVTEGERDRLLSFRRLQRTLDTLESENAPEGKERAMHILVALLDPLGTAGLEVAGAEGQPKSLLTRRQAAMRVYSPVSWRLGVPRLEVAVSTVIRARIRYEPENESEESSALLLTRALGEYDIVEGTSRSRLISADGLSDELSAVLAWTEWRHENRGALLWWPFARFPEYDDLVTWTKGWREVVEHARTQRDPFAKLAFGWIARQAHAVAGKGSNEINWKVKDELTEKDWEAMFKSLKELQARDDASSDYERWRTRDLPLLAAPEFGLDEKTQMWILNAGHANFAPGTSKSEWMAELEPARREAISNAFWAFEELLPRAPDRMPDDNDVDRALKAAKDHWSRAPWYTFSSSGKARGEATPNAARSPEATSGSGRDDTE